MKKWKAVLLTICMAFTLVSYGIVKANDKDEVLEPRVPADKMATAKGMYNPSSADQSSIAAGKDIYFGKGTCVNCHGEKGKGDGEGGSSFEHKPRDFTDIKWQKARTDGEIFWAISEGTEEGMIPFGDNLSPEERWTLVNYIRSFDSASSTAKAAKVYGYSSPQ